MSFMIAKKIVKIQKDEENILQKNPDDDIIKI